MTKCPHVIIYASINQNAMKHQLNAALTAASIALASCGTSPKTPTAPVDQFSSEHRSRKEFNDVRLDEHLVLAMSGNFANKCAEIVAQCIDIKDKHPEIREYNECTYWSLNNYLQAHYEAVRHCERQILPQTPACDENRILDANEDEFSAYKQCQKDMEPRLTTCVDQTRKTNLDFIKGMGGSNSFIDPEQCRNMAKTNEAVNKFNECLHEAVTCTGGELVEI